MGDDILYYKLYLNLTAEDLHVTPTFKLAGGVITPLINLRIDRVELRYVLRDLLDEFGEERLIEIIKTGK